MRTIHQINLQRHFGGGEVYTRFLSNALVEAGWPVELYVHSAADFWGRLDMPGVHRVRVDSLDEIYAASNYSSLHTNLTPETRDMISAKSFPKMKKGVLILNCDRG